MMMSTLANLDQDQLLDDDDDGNDDIDGDDDSDDPRLPAAQNFVFKHYMRVYLRCLYICLVYNGMLWYI